MASHPCYTPRPSPQLLKVGVVPARPFSISCESFIDGPVSRLSIKPLNICRRYAWNQQAFNKEAPAGEQPCCSLLEAGPTHRDFNFKPLKSTNNSTSSTASTPVIPVLRDLQRCGLLNHGFFIESFGTAGRPHPQHDSFGGAPSAPTFNRYDQADI